MFFLMRYQIIVASSREINFARQFSSVSLVHRIETKIARQFFEVRLFILLCSKISLMRRPPCSYIALNSARMANWKCRPSLRRQITAPLQSLVPPLASQDRSGIVFDCQMANDPAIIAWAPRHRSYIAKWLGSYEFLRRVDWNSFLIAKPPVTSLAWAARLAASISSTI
jgi:hypothetical protein